MEVQVTRLVGTCSAHKPVTGEAGKSRRKTAVRQYALYCHGSLPTRTIATNRCKMISV